MNSEQGVFIAIEGTDGSGKGTQFKLLAERLIAAGYDVATFDFPRYDEPSSYFVKEYLNGSYGTAAEVGPYTGSLFYALDRYQAASQIRQALEEGKVVLANRFTGSNMAHQGTKFHHPEERRGYFIWLDNLEFEMLHIPRPDNSIVLRVPAETAQNLIDRKSPRSYTNSKRDLHEADLNHLQLSVEVYDDLCKLFPKDFTQINCVKNGELLSITAINNLIWDNIAPKLPTKKPSLVDKKAKGNPYITKDSRGFHMVTVAGKDFLRECVTDAEDSVYAFTGKLSPAIIAAAVSRLPHSNDDMRSIILKEIATAADNDKNLLHKTMATPGDESVKQLVGQHIIVEGASNLLAKKLEWGRLATYVEQSPRYSHFDQKDSNGNYKYYTPEHLDENTKNLYQASMDEIFELYSLTIGKLTTYIRQNSQVPKSEQDITWQDKTRAQACDALHPMLPIATTSTVGIYVTGEALERLITHLQSDELSEAVVTGQKLLDHARKVIPAFLETVDKPDYGGAVIAYRANTSLDIKKLAEKYLPNHHSSETEAVHLTNVWPRNELDLVPDMLYEHSSLPLKEIEKAVSSWSYDQKSAVFQAYIGERLNRRDKPGRALEKAHYSWDLVCDYTVFSSLQRHRMVDDLEWQLLSPRHGYETPQLVEDAGLEEAFESCFDISLKLHSALQKAGYWIEAQYATLMGHKMRWKVTYNAREAFHLHELRTSPQSHPGQRKIVLQMHEKLAEIHPLLAEGMKFVNQADDPELDRLAAEKYTRFKLQQFSSTNK